MHRSYGPLSFRSAVLEGALPCACQRAGAPDVWALLHAEQQFCVVRALCVRVTLLCEPGRAHGVHFFVACSMPTERQGQIGLQWWGAAVAAACA